MSLVKSIFTCIAILALTSAMAQYSVSGIVVDANTGEALIGATVTIKGTTKGKITDLSGQFSIGGLSENAVVLEATYVGYKHQDLAITLSHERTLVTIKMTESPTTLGEVVVEGAVEGQIAAMVTMKKAANIKNVVSAEQIVTFPDLNAAEVMQRIPGITLQRDQGDGRYVQLRGTPPQFTNFSINGEQVPSPEGRVRYIGLDIIPSDQIDFIEVTKVLTPDMDGDGIGGSVNVKTKEAKDGPPEIGAVMSSGYNNLRQTPNYNFQFSYGQRYEKFGFQVNSSFFENSQGSDNIEYKFTKGPFFSDNSQQEGQDNYYLHYREFQLRHYNISRRRTAVSPSFDYKFNEYSKVYVKAMFNSFTDVETRRRKTYDLEDPLTFESYLYGGIEHETRFRTKEQQLNTIAAGGEHTLGIFKVDYQMFFSKANEDIPDYFEVAFDNPGQAIRININHDNPNYPRAEYNSDNATDYENYELEEFQIENSTVSTRLLTPRINVEIPYVLGNGQDGFFKFGGKVRSREKKYTVRNTTFGNYRPVNNPIYAGEGEPLNLAAVSNGWQENNLLNKGYEMDYMPDRQMMLDHYEFNKQYYVMSRNDSRSNAYNSQYDFKENIYAAYGMVRHNIGGLMILGGLRFERTDVIKNSGKEVILDGSRFIGIQTLDTTNTQDFWLPQLQLKYELTPKINLRAAITRTYSRPNYEDLIYAREDDDDEVRRGTPFITYPTSTNIDLMIERYFKTSIFSAGLFYKQIDDFIFKYVAWAREGEAGSGNYPPREVTIPLNGQTAEVLGAELQAQFKLDFLPGFLSNFGLYTNYTYTHSQAYIPKRAPANYAQSFVTDFSAESLISFFSETEQEKISLPGQAEHTANFALFYDGPKFFARLSANYQDDFLYEIGADPDLDEYYDTSFRLDYTMNYKLNDNIKFFADFINLTNTPLRYYLGTDKIVKQQEFYSFWCRGGVRLNF